MGDDRDLQKYTRRSALGLMTVGGGLVASETWGFTNLTAGRGVKLNVDNDLNAVLGIVADGKQIADNQFTSPVTIDFMNRSNETIAIDVEVTEQNGEQITVEGFGSTKKFSNRSESFTTDIYSSKSLEITVEEAATTDISLTVTSAEFGGVSVELQRGNVTVDNSS